MGKLAKVLAGIAIVVVVLVAAVVIAVMTVDPNTLIAPVQAQVRAATGRDLTVRGGARIALSLHPRIVLTDVTLGNAPWGTAKELARVDRLELAAALMPLLSRRFELEEIVLVGPQINLETDGKGQKNWQPPSAAASVPSKGGGTSLAAAVAIGEVDITNGVVTYRDGPGAPLSRVSVQKLSLRPRALTSSVAIDFRGVVGDVPVAVEGKVGSFESLLAKAWPYPIDVRGEVAGQPFAIATRVTAEASRYTLDQLKLTLGANALSGTFAVDASGPRTMLLFDLSAPALALSALPIPVAPAAAAPAPTPARGYVFPATPVSFAPLRWSDAQGKVAVGRLSLPNGQQYDELRVRLALDGGRLDVPDFAVAAFGGTLTGNLSIDARRSDDALVSLHVDGKGLSLGRLLTAAGHPREVSGGKTEVAATLTMRGNSPHAWASTATGNLRVVSGPATLTNSKLDVTAAWDKLSEAINPFRARDPSTDLQCAVVRFPLANGIAKVDRSIAMETNKIGVSASGTLDFRNETLDFTFQPKVRKGISIDFAGLADLVRVSGPFASPHLAVDAAGSAKVIASVGAAISTGGLSAVGQTLFAWADGQGPGPCQIALGAAAPAPSAAPAKRGDPSVPIASDLGKALGKLFGR